MSKKHLQFKIPDEVEKIFKTIKDKGHEMHKLPPWEIKEVKPKIEVFNNHIKDPKHISWDSDTLPDILTSSHHEGHQIIFIVHGFSQNIKAEWMYKLKDAILKAIDKNVSVLVCGWGGGAHLHLNEYFQAAKNTQTAGEKFGKIARKIKDANPETKIWGIGHSLGAHVLGWAGHYSKRSFNRITGLDPAGLAFEQKELQDFYRCLDENDATEMVDVIHTDGCGIPAFEWLHLGTLLPLGKIDFYPNYGIQPYSLKHPLFTYYHSLAITMMIQSFEEHEDEMFKCTEVLNGTPKFDKPVKKTKPADGYAMMGYHADREDCKKTGQWYLKYHLKKHHHTHLALLEYNTDQEILLEGADPEFE